jgi:uncharacterized protein (DUF1778 family)
MAAGKRAKRATPKDRRKADEDRKDRSIQIRVTDEQKETLTAAAKRRGLGLSSWMLSVSLEAAAKSASDG